MKLETNFLLSKITTFELGGPAKFYLQATSPEEVVAAILIAQDKKIKYCLVGGGSNLVFSDKGFAGLVIHFNQSKFKRNDIEIKGNRVIVSAGIVWADFVKKVSRLGLAGVEKMAAIPGCIGGAVVGNAGAYGQDISQVLDWVEVFDGQEIKKLTSQDCRFAYRDSLFKHQNLVALRVGFKFKKGDSQKLIKEVKSISQLRLKKFGRHPICAGSFFKNVYKDGERIPTAKIIEQAGLINLKRGGISIAPWHHNFLINDGTGTTKDLLTLAKKIKKVVHQKLGIELEEEVRFMLK